MDKVQEKPHYVLKQSKKRTIIPKILSLLFLGGIFYLGIILNLSLLNLDSNLNQTIKLVATIVLISIAVLGTILSVLKARKTYLFFRDRVTFGRKIILYTDISNIIPHLDPIDRVFKTYSINLGHKFVLRHISQKTPVQNYLQQLINYAKKS